MAIKQWLYETLKNKNYFDHGKTDSLKVLERTRNLEDVILQVERSCNVDNILFRYNPKTGKFHRVTLTDKDKELLRREDKYQHRFECIKRKCFSQAIDVETFIRLLSLEFEPVAIYHVTERFDIIQKYHK